MLQPAKVATPAIAAFGFVVQTSTAPAGVVIDSCTELVSVVTVLPPASSTATTGCVSNAAPPAAPAGCVVNTSCDAAPTAFVNDALTAEVSEPSLAVNVYVPTRSMLHDEYVATPSSASTGLVVHVSVAPPGVVSASVTELVSVVTVLPPASSTATTGWVSNAEPPDAPAGCVVYASFDAGPTLIVNALLTAEVRPGAVAVTV